MPREPLPRPAIVLDTLACVVEPEAEFLMLFDLRERTSRRLAELATLLTRPLTEAGLSTLSHREDRNA